MEEVDYWKKEVQCKDVVIDTLNKEIELQKTIIAYLIQIAENTEEIDKYKKKNNFLKTEINRLLPQQET